LESTTFAMAFAGEMRMPFADRLAALRRTKGLTQQQLAERVGLHQSQIHRYESGSSEPSMDALRRLALALGVTTDELVFEEGERDVPDELRLQFEAISRFDPEDRKAAKAFLDVLILKHEAKRWASAS
jgi:transcriptional regulator with XRE-family HTH domain